MIISMNDTTTLCRLHNSIDIEMDSILKNLKVVVQCQRRYEFDADANLTYLRILGPRTSLVL